FTARYDFSHILYRDSCMEAVISQAVKFSYSDSNILIHGETGTGKELFAQSIHNSSRRRKGPFVAINCAALPENLLESELFGYVEGAFTGASRGGKMGFFEIAHKGTIFLDEIGDISPKLQSRLLRVIQEREIIRLGNDTVIPIDVRVICATNRDLKKEVSRGNFREDLLYRLDVLELNLPPLRKRKQDILYLADRMVRFEHERTGSRLEAITQEGRELLMRYNWPGNVREMRNFCERICILCEKTRAGAEDVLQALPGEWEHGEGADSQYAESRHAESRYAESRHADSGSGSADFPASGSHVPAEAAGRGPRLEEAQRQAVKDALELCGYHRGRTAVYLGIDKSTLWRKMKKYGIEG
ncbi:sigma-54 interaction domain-containing protein, partial [Eisenbergiella sp.]